MKEIKSMKDVKTKNILEQLRNGVMLGAEGYLYEFERRGYLKAGPFVPEVVLDFPDAVKELHREFLLAGSEVMVAYTYYAHREQLKKVGRENDLERMNRQAVRLANEVAREGDALVAGNICNTWAYDPNNSQKTSQVVRAIYEEQLTWAVEGGIDFVIAETNDYLEEALIALDVIKQFGLPAMVTFATIRPDETHDGYGYIDACRTLADRGADIVGFNCSRGPATMLPLVEKVRSAVQCYVAAQPVPFHTTEDCLIFERLQNSRGEAGHLFLEPFLCNRFEMADFARRARDIGANYIGICCGGAPYHVRSMAEALGRTVPASKYSPAMELHPTLGDQVAERYQEVLTDWKD